MISGDEILSVNGMAVQGMSHSEAISIFKNIKIGLVTLYVARRDSHSKRLVERQQFLYNVLYLLRVLWTNIYNGKY